MSSNVFSFILGASIFFIVGAIVGEESTKATVALSQAQHIRQGYIKAYTDQMGYDIGVLAAKCKLSGGEYFVNGERVACLKEMTND